MEHTFTLTKKQQAKLDNLLELLYTRAAKSEVIPVPMLLLIGGVRRAVLDEDGLDQPQTDVILWALDLLFIQMKDDEYDPQLEQLYHKLAGWWPVEPPWYERIKDEPK